MIGRETLERTRKRGIITNEKKEREKKNVILILHYEPSPSRPTCNDQSPSRYHVLCTLVEHADLRSVGTRDPDVT